MKAQKKKPAEAASIELYTVALALVHERGELLKLLRDNAVLKESDAIFNAALKRLQDLEEVSHEVQLALCNVVSVKNVGGEIKTIGKEKLGAVVLHRPPAVHKQGARAAVYGDGKPTPHNTLRRLARSEGERSPF